jgi:uncharacterized Zn finger protein
MTLRLENFEDVIDPVILERGRNYYLACRVADLEELEEGSWVALVEGSETYEVTIERDEGGDLDCFCDCPYDWGPTCKHIAAVLFTIRDASAAPPAAAASEKPKQSLKAREESLRAALMALSREELVALLMEVTRKDSLLRRKLLSRFGDE